MTRWLVTGCAGFIGFHVTRRLLEAGDDVVGLDDLNDYYDPRLKLARLAQLPDDGFRFRAGDVATPGLLDATVAEHQPTRVIHLAAQAGVRQALLAPLTYARSNLLGFVQVLETCARFDVEHLVYASSSSVYGETSRIPFSVHDPADHPVSLYAATKRSNELLAHSYSHVHGLPTTGLRFFTVYGPWGRPDMAYYSFAEAILAGRPITIFGDGSALRDFTYIDDIVEGVVRVADRIPAPDPAWLPSQADPATSPSPFRVHNIGRGEQHTVDEMIALLERALRRPAHRVYAPPQPGDVSRTHAEVDELFAAVGHRPATSLATGIERFAAWLHDYQASRSRTIATTFSA
ncbi:MAG TPA: NAD-dependent epimerase/dehydratase family protein [Egicoccus sp.]|nr:NAD-dependent epimerase/dehydratase family protein [Egicoccus sp.]HSK21709.1 NAD-dependent epimerase/dehydratase family protein [Egicoccus sp.]